MAKHSNTGKAFTQQPTMQPRNVNLAKYLQGKHISANMSLINGCHESNWNARPHVGLRKLVEHVFVFGKLCQFNECRETFGFPIVYK